MKILSVKFQNLNSLKGAHEIRFDEAPFTESGLFAITGPTGAGKTTILDAITVALYGRAPRHEKEVAEMMSRHTGEAFSEVEFEVNGKEFRAKWSVNRARGKADGAIQACKMELAELPTGNLIGGNTLTVVQKSIVELCGLDFSQFLRSVMLSQGDFAKFLKADDNDRSGLLEKITDTGIYTDISRYIFEKAKEERQKTEQLSSKLNDVELLPADDREEMENSLLVLQSQEKALKSDQSILTEKMAWLKKLDELGKRLKEYQSALEEAQLSFQERKADFEKLSLHEKAVPFRPDLVELKGLEEQKEKLVSELFGWKEQLPLEQEQLERLGRDLEQAQRLATELEKQFADSASLFDKVIESDTNINGLSDSRTKLALRSRQSQEEVQKLAELLNGRKAELDQTMQRLADQEEWLKRNEAHKDLEKDLVVFTQYLKELNGLAASIISDEKTVLEYEEQKKKGEEFIQSNQEQLQALQGKQLEVSTTIVALENEFAEKLGGRILEDIEAEYNRLPLNIRQLEQQQQLREEYIRELENKERLQQDLGSKREQLDALDKVLKNDQEKLEAAEAHLSDLQQLVEAQQKIKNFEAERLALNLGQECPLCGSTDHPYLNGKYAGHLDDSLVKRKLQEEKVREFRELVQTGTLLRSEVAQGLKLSGEMLPGLESRLEKISFDFEGLNQELQVGNTLENAEKIAALLESKRSLQVQLKGTVQELKALAGRISSAKEEQSADKGKLAEIENKASLDEQKLETIHINLERVKASLEENTRLRQQQLGNLTLLLNTYGIDFNQERAGAIQKELETASEAYKRSQVNIQQLKIDEAQGRTELEKLLESLNEKTKASDQLKADLEKEDEKLESMKQERFNLFEHKDPVTERQRLQAGLRSAQERRERLLSELKQKEEQCKLLDGQLQKGELLLNDLNGQLNGVVSGLIARLKTAGIAGMEELKSLFLEEALVEELARIKAELLQKIYHVENQVNIIGSELKGEQVKNLTEKTHPELEEEFQVKDAEYGHLKEETGRLGEKIREDDRLKQSYAKLAEEIEVQKKEFERWNRLERLIGSADGKKFSRFAQGLTLARLTELANRHLQKLTDRYEIIKTKEKDLELQIVDHYQADVVRPVTTLSGGESFLVSLALALGLSDLASRKVQIQSLFIDEGFGTLDADTLDTAISALENLQSNGKTIGIISHVEALKERIGTQIQVSKGQGGASKIKVLAGGMEVQV